MVDWTQPDAYPDERPHDKKVIDILTNAPPGFYVISTWTENKDFERTTILVGKPLNIPGLDALFGNLKTQSPDKQED